MTSDRSLPDTGELRPSAMNFPVVGLGASAGGLPALQRFFEAMPADPGMAFVVILHLSPEHASDAPAVLQRATAMKVVQVRQPCSIERDHVYVIPPSKQLSMNDSYLRVTDSDRPRQRHAEIDLFFRSLALVHRERAFGIVLSGTGSDGAVGIAKLKEQGGVTLAQSPGDAEFDSMPRAAIATGAIDWVLPAAEMPKKLLDLWANARAIELPGDGEEEAQAALPLTREAHREAEEALREIMRLVRLRTGNDFRHYKRATLLRRIERRLQVNGVPNLPAYRALLQEQPGEARALLDDLLIGVTNFFRDREAFEALEREVVPQLFEPGPDAGPVRAWVAGCSSGEEAYSVAMLLAERAQALSGGAPEIQVFATDIDEHAIALARAGLYPDSISADVSPERLRHFFNREGNQYRIRKELRERILFAVHNLLRDPPFSKLDLVCCRNLLIYLDREVHAQILEMFHFALRPGGHLFLGSSESADAALQLFTVVDKKNRIYRANELAHPPRYSSTLPVGIFESKPAGPRDPAADRRRVGYAEIHRRLAEQHAPPSVLVDAEANIVHLSEQAGRFLRHAGGAPSHQLLSLVLPELRLELRTALFQALQSSRSVEARRVKIEEGEGPGRYVNMTVRPVTEPGLGAPLALVLFAEVEETMGPEAHGAGGEGRDPLVLQLEEELKRTKEQLQETIEQAETSTEELKASNEELQAINEELRSATEELETSKEELQSINEELITVNHELKSKVEETGKINDDLQNLIASTDIATVFIDRAMSIKRYTPRATDIFSLIPTDVGRSLLDIRHRLDYEQLADDATAAFQSLRLIEREVASRDGRWYLARMLPYRTTEDRIDGAVLTFIDITSRRQAEERLRDGERRMRLVAESTKDYAIITLDTGGRITSWNRAAERLFGHTEAQALGQPSAMLFPPEDREAAAEGELRRAREDGRAEDDRWHLRRDGRPVFCSGVTTPLYIDGRLQGYAKIARDVTDTKHQTNEREARLAREEAGRAEAQAASDMKDEFLAILSHELKNPLNLIQMNAELLARLPEAQPLPAVRSAAQTIRETVHSQAQIIDDLLDLSRLNTGKFALARGTVDLGAVARRIVDAMAQDAARKSLALAFEAPAGPVLLHADGVRVEQIVWNLLSNAIKFTPEGGEVRVRVAAEPGFGRLEVSDTGRGIEPAFLPRLFDMFEQAESRSVRREGGLGIGLALVRQLAELHGGRVEAGSPGPGQGSTFVVHLPLLAREAASAPPPPASGGREFEGLRVLLVDDDEHGLAALALLLQMEGMDVTAVPGAREALRRCEAADFDLIVSDIAMPEMDGHQLVAALRAMPRHAATPTVALTGFGRPADIGRAAAAGFDLHLGKPVQLERLLQALRTLGLHGRPAAAAR